VLSTYEMQGLDHTSSNHGVIVLKPFAGRRSLRLCSRRGRVGSPTLASSVGSPSTAAAYVVETRVVTSMLLEP